MTIKSILEKLIASLLVLILLPLALIISLSIKLSSSGDILFWSQRVGIDNDIFSMPKFSTMKPNTPKVATHLLNNPEKYFTRIGSFLRKTSLDEIPQLLSIIKGDMGFIGPRPALFNQDELIRLRTEKGIHKLKPGITGWAQVNGRDELSIQEKVSFEDEYLNNKSFMMDMHIIWLTLIKVVFRKEISH